MQKEVTILLVEDDKDDQEFFMDALTQIKILTACHISENGVEAMHKLKSETYFPDLIFMDINMPKMDGIECLIHIIESPVHKNIPVVMFSTDIGKMDMARSLGAKGFINKHVNGDTLRLQIEQMITLDFVNDSTIAGQTFKTATGRA
jgi:CheY-like chemotaxis protein